MTPAQLAAALEVIYNEEDMPLVDGQALAHVRPGSGLCRAGVGGDVEGGPEMSDCPHGNGVCPYRLYYPAMQLSPTSRATAVCGHKPSCDRPPWPPQPLMQRAEEMK